NPVLFDDFFISVGAFNATVPYVPATGASEIVITGYVYNLQGNSFSLTWGTIPGIAYTVQHRNKLSDAWTDLATGYPAGGATGTSTSYTDNAPSQPSGFYRVVYKP